MSTLWVKEWSVEKELSKVKLKMGVVRTVLWSAVEGNCVTVRVTSEETRM